MSVYYKFNSELNFSHVGFDGLHISVQDLKKAILHQKRLGKSDFDLMITNAQTKEEYVEDDCLIPKNTSLIVARVPITSNNQYKKWEQTGATHNKYDDQQNNITSSASTVDLFKMNGSEEDKIQAMITQSTLDYDPTNYQRVRGSQQSGEVPHHYRCHRCHKSGHWIKNCPLNPPMKEHHMKIRAENKKMTGIPRSLRENPPTSKETDLHQFVEQQKKEIPEDLICSICKNIFKDAVMIPCCGSSFCDECIRTSLLESDDNECPECSEKGTSPGSLIPNRFLRNAVASFQSDANSLSTRDKQHEFSTVKNQEEEFVHSSEVVQEKSENSNAEFLAKNKENDNPKALKSDQMTDDDDDDDDNITVTVPSASQQSGAEFRESMVFHIPRQDSSQESENVEVREKSKPREYSETPNYSSSSYYQGNNSNNNNPYDGSSKNMSNSYQENMDKSNYQSHPISNPYHQSHGGYNQHHPSNMHVPQHRPHQYSHQGQYHQSGPPHQSYYNHHQQNMRPMRYEHGNYHGMNKHHNMPPMHAPMNDHFGGMRYQPPSANLANMVTQNIQQRFGTGIIEDPLEAFNKIMREKEMRKDRFKRSRSPLRQYSPDMRQKSPIRRRKRTRSFSSDSSSSSRSYDRHYSKENVHGRDYRGDARRKHYVPDRKKSESRSSRIAHRRTPNEVIHSKKSNHEKRSSSHENRQEKSKPVLPEPSNNIHNNDGNNSTNDAEPPPPGIEIATSSQPIANNTNTENQIQQKDEEKSHASPSEKEMKSADESKHSKKSRERKKHKKESRKKKKRDRKEKKSTSKSNTPEIEDKSMIKKSISSEQIDENPKQNDEEINDDHFEDNLSQHESKNETSIDETNYDEPKFNDYTEPELSKWERDESQNEKNNEQQKITTVIQSANNSEVTSEIIKRAENAIFTKAVNAIRPPENSKSSISKTDNSSTIANKRGDSDKKYEISVQVTADNSGNRSIEIKSEETGSMKGKIETSKPASIKDRLGKKIDVRSRSRSREDRRYDHDRKNVRKPYQLTSYVSSVSKYSDKRTTEKRRSRSHENRPTIRKYERSRSRSANRSDHKKVKISDEKRPHHKSTIDEKPESSKSTRDKRTKSSERERHRSRSPKPSSSSRINERSRSSSAESRKHSKKKKKKEKKSKKKSRESR